MRDIDQYDDIKLLWIEMKRGEKKNLSKTRLALQSIFEEIKVRTYPAFSKESSEASRASNEKDAVFKKLYVYYSKRGQAKYFGHLELVISF